MKLLSRYNRVNVLATVIVLLISGLCYYFIIRYVLLDQMDDDLKVEEQEIYDYVKTHNSLPDPSNYKDQKVSFQLTENPITKKTFSSQTLFSKEENESVSSRQVVFPIMASSKNYIVYISKSQEETEDLIQLILLITLAILVVLLLALFIINRFLMYKLWQPFNNTLKVLKQINFSHNQELKLEAGGIKEFSDLNEAVTIMSNRLNQEYTALKKFTENASHEMQTPLAVINSKLDVLIQDETISEFQMQQLTGIYNALDRLSKMNQSLLLLTKIDNNQFNDFSMISIDTLINNMLTEFEELSDTKNLTVTKELNTTNIRSNKELVDILITNLLNNAIRYNKQNGSINIKLEHHILYISNLSFVPELDSQRVFQRFYRHTDTKQDGNGLGLSIIKQICELSGFSISYSYTVDRHEFLVRF